MADVTGKIPDGNRAEDIQSNTPSVSVTNSTKVEVPKKSINHAEAKANTIVTAAKGTFNKSMSTPTGVSGTDNG